MKKLLLLFFIVLLGVSANAQTNCSTYRKGYFMYTDSLGNTIIVQRKKKYQYEYNRKMKVRTQFIIKWNSDCEYTITQTITNSRSLKKIKIQSALLLFQNLMEIMVIIIPVIVKKLI